MIIKCINRKDINLNIDKNIDLNELYEIIVKKTDNIYNKNSILLISNNIILNNNNLNNFIDEEVYLYINKNKNKIKNKNNIIEITEILNSLFNFEVNIENYDDNLNKLIEMGYDEEVASEALDNNNINLLESINYLLEIS